MVRADIMDCVDKFLRIHGNDPSQAFGGIQMVFIGDLYQLPPVIPSKEKQIFKEVYATPYFFSGKFFDDYKMEFVELDYVYRQKDGDFVGILNAIRNNTVTDNDLKLLNSRVDKEFVPEEKDLYIYLVPTNKHAEEINSERLAKLNSKSYNFTGEIDGEFAHGNLPTLIDLEVKIGSQIMMMNNDKKGRWINGTIGQVIDLGDYTEQANDHDQDCTYLDDEDIDKDKDDNKNTYIVIKLETGRTVWVYPFAWELYRYTLEDGMLKSDVVGTFKQYPMKLAWAITIHKSQGKTFNKAIIDIGRSVFTSGQTYVALSRCTSLEGMVLKKPIAKKHIWSDRNIVRFITEFQYDKSEKDCSLEEKISILEKSANDEKTIDIVYLKANDVKSKQSIIPLKVKQMTFKGKDFMGVIAYCKQKQDERIFRIDRILEIA